MKPSLVLSYKRGKSAGIEHWLVWDGKRKPYVPNMHECHSIDIFPSDVVIDIGAYCGTYGLWAAKKGAQMVRAYEPSPISFKALERNAQGIPNFEAYRAAVVPGDEKFVTFHISPRGLGCTNSLLPSKVKQPTRVPAVSYEVATRDATVIKIDVEGAEYGLPILEKMPSTLRAMIIDFHPLPKRAWQDAARRIIAGLHARGFQTVIEPNWASAWQPAGSWHRDV
jgi:FkbM family methyltransferase